MGGVGVQLGTASLASAQTGSNSQIPYIQTNLPNAIKRDNYWLVNLEPQAGSNGYLETITLEATGPTGRFESGTYTVSRVDGSASETVQATVVEKDGRNLVEINLTQPMKVEAGKIFQVRFDGDASNFPDSQNYKPRYILSPTEPNYPTLNLENVGNFGGKQDPNLGLGGERCDADGELAGQVTTWIAESYYIDGNGKTLHDQKRDHTVLNYRENRANADNPLETSRTKWVYNALAYNPKDGYLYAISQDRPLDGTNSGSRSHHIDPDYYYGVLLRISPVTGEVAPVGRIQLAQDPENEEFDREAHGGFTNGAFDLEGNFIFANNSESGTGAIYRVAGATNEDGLWIPDNDGNSVDAEKTSLVEGRPRYSNDWTYFGFEQSPYIWSLSGEGGTATLYRTDTETGETIEWDKSEISGGDALVSGGVYGNAWTYDNGNLGFSDNGSGDAFEIQVENYDAGTKDQIAVSVVGQEKVPTSYNNDAATNAVTIHNNPCDAPGVEIKKYINGRDDNALVNAEEKMTITYRISNTGAVRIEDIRLTDQIDEQDDDLQEEINRQLADAGLISLDPGESRDIDVQVDAPIGHHKNTARLEVPSSVTLTETPEDDASSDSPRLALKKEIRRKGEGEEAWRDAEEASDALPIGEGEPMELRYTVTNIGSVTLNDVGVVDTVTKLGDDEVQLGSTQIADPESDLAKFQKELRDALDNEGAQGFTLEPGASREIIIDAKAPAGYHVNEAVATAAPVTATETMVSSIPGTTNAATTVPGSLTSSPTVVERTPNTPTNKAQSTPTVDPTPPAVPEDPKFAVEKVSGQNGITLERNDNGQYAYSAQYTIRVRNTGTVDGEHATIWDSPLRGVGFSIDNVTIDGAEVAPQSGRYKVADASDLAVGESKEYVVVVNGTVTDEAANALPAAVGQCDASLDNPGANSGLVNVVSMGDDSDGPANNVVCEPVELRRLNIEKRINGLENAPVAPGEDMEIWYRVRNSGNVTLSGITLADQIQEGDTGLQDEITAALDAVEPFDLAPGEVRDEYVTITATEGTHVNEARAEVPPTTIPGTTVPESTVPGTSNETTTVPPSTVPGTTIPERPVPPTTVTATAKASSPKIEVKKFINGRDEHALVTAGEEMTITYRVTNTGAVKVDGVRLTDQIKQDNPALQQAIDAQLGKVAPFALESGESRDVEVKVEAPAGRHDNTVNVTVPPVTVPGTTIPETTAPPRTTVTTVDGTPTTETIPGTPIPGTTVPETVVTVTADPDDAASDSVNLEILKEIKRADEGEDAWRDAETPADALPIKQGQPMQIRYTVRNTGSIDLTGVDIVDEVSRLDDATEEEIQALTDEINGLIEAEGGRGITLAKGEEQSIVIDLKAPKGYHVDVAKATAPAVTATETFERTLPPTTNQTTTRTAPVVTTVTEPVEVTPPTPTNKAQSTPIVDAVQPQFAVEKLGAQSAINLVREGDAYKYTAEYTIRVRNTGSIAGQHAPVWDVPVRGVGFSIDDLTVDGTKVDAESGRYKIADASELGVREYTDYRVAINGTVTEKAAEALPAAVGQCKDVTPENPAAGSGLANSVNMVGDSDGPANNVVCSPVELRRLNIEKRIDGRENTVVDPAAETVEIWYRVRNTGNVTLENIALADQVVDDQDGLQEEINNALAEQAKPFSLEPGAFEDIRIEVKAPKGEHTNIARAEVPETTIPGTTRPATTIPGTTVPPITEPSTTIPATTIPDVTIPGTTEPGTTVPATTVTATATANSPKLSVKKFINGRDDHALVTASEEMTFTYRVVNEGVVKVDGIRLVDKIKEDNPALQQAIDAQLGKVAPFSLEPGQSRDVEVKVEAPAGRHDNTVNVTVPPVTIPATSIPGTTNATTTVPGTEVPSTVVTVTADPDDAASDSLTLEILKEIKGADGKWRDAETANDAAPVLADGKMDLRYTVTNTGSVAISGVAISDKVEKMESGQDKLQAAIDAALKAKVEEQFPEGINLEPGEDATLEITVDAPEVAHTNVAQATAPAVTTTETFERTLQPTTDGTTTRTAPVVTTVTEPVEVVPNTPSNKAQSTPTTNVPPQTVVTTAPREEQPQFAVEKLSARAGNVSLTRNDDGGYDYSNEYVIRVRNTGTIDGEHATVWDVPLRGAGFTATGVTVDDQPAELVSGRYKIAEGAEIKAGEYREFRVNVTGTITEAAANTLPAAVGQCDADGANPSADSGLVNVVNMGGDSDGPANNVVCTPVELRRLVVEKRIDGREDAVVTPGEDMEIWYRVRNTGNVALNDITLADKIQEDNKDLQDQIDAELEKNAKPFNLEPGAYEDIKITVKAPEGEHVNEVRADVPPVTVPPTTRPATTIPGTTGPSTTVPPVTIPKTTIPGTTEPGITETATARANSPKLEVKKYINGRDDNALVTAGEDMDITYRVSNPGTIRVDGIRLVDKIKEDNADLQQAIDAQLGQVEPFALEPGESRDVTVTVEAPAGRHDDTVNVTVPPVTIPGTTLPGTTVPPTVVTVTADPDDASTDSPQLEILKEIKRADEDDDAWRDAEVEGDALPVAPGEDMQLRYTVTNTGSVALTGVDVVDKVTRLDDGDADAYTKQINELLEKEGRNLSLDKGETKVIEITIKAPEGYHVNEAIATAPPVTATEIVVTSVPGTTNETTTVPGSLVTSTTTVERVPNTPTNKAQSTPTADCDCEVTTVTETPDPVTTTLAGELTTIVPDPVTSEVTVTQTEPKPVPTTVVETPDPVTTTLAGELTTIVPDPVTSEVTVTQTEPKPVPTTVVETPEPITVTRTSPVTTVQTVTQDPVTVTQTPDPDRVVVIVDEGGKGVTTVQPTPRPEGGAPSTETVTYTLPPITADTLTTTVTPRENVLERCVANAVRSPILYMVPLLLAGQVLGDLAAPYVKQVNDQFNRMSAEIQDEIRRNTPDWGFGRRGHDNEQAAELRARVDAANRMLQELVSQPDVQKYGQWAAIAAGVVVAGSVLYDWCTNEAGEAFTAIGPKSTEITDVQVGSSSLSSRNEGEQLETIEPSVPPVTVTPGSEESSAGSSAGSSN